MVQSAKSAQASEGLRERKRRQTLQRITDAGVGLFLKQGYDATTLDDIAAAADISRRTFFYYFKSKDDILLSMQDSMGAAVREQVRTAPTGKTPVAAVRDALVQICAQFPPDEMIALDKVMRSSPAVQARKQGSYVQQEQKLMEVMRERWPERSDMAHRLTAMMAIGTMRLSFDTLSREEGKRPIAAILNETFDALEAGV